MLTWKCHLFQLAGGGGTSSSVVSAASAPASTVSPASVTAPSSWSVIGGGGLCRRRRPVMPVRPPVMPVTPLSSPPTLPWTASWACSGGAECPPSSASSYRCATNRSPLAHAVAASVAQVNGGKAPIPGVCVTIKWDVQASHAAAQALHPPCSPAGRRLWLVVGSPAEGAWPEVGAPAPEC